MNEYVKYLEELLESCVGVRSVYNGEFIIGDHIGQIHTQVFSNEYEDNTAFIYSGLGDTDSYAYPVRLKSKEQVDALLLGLGIKG